MARLPQVQKYLKYFGRCPECDAVFSAAQVALIKRRVTDIEAHARCLSCRISLIVKIFFLADGAVTSVGMVTDLTPADAKYFADMSPVSAEEVVEIYNTLHQGSKSRNPRHVTLTQ